MEGIFDGLFSSSMTLDEKDNFSHWIRMISCILRLICPNPGIADQLRFESDGALRNFEGAYLDNVRVYGQPEVVSHLLIR